MSDSIGAFQNDLDDLEDLDDIRYENIFRVFTKDKKYFYNILKKVSISVDDVNTIAIDTVRVQLDTTWPLLSYRVYKTIHLWWIIALANDIINPLEGVKGGDIIKIIKPGYIRLMLEEINEELTPI